jgi:putative ABC transport system permease protein
MVRQYLKQTWNLLRQEKVFSAIYILGTGLSITVVMAMAIVFYIRIADIYPETNRSRMLIVSRGVAKLETGGSSSGFISHSFIQTCFKSMKSAEAVCVVSFGNNFGKSYVQLEGSRRQIPVKMLYTDESFWKVFGFRFREGKPYSEAEVQSGIATVVISRSLARRLFGEAEAIGQSLSLDFRLFRVCGVVDDAPWVANNSYAQVWAPYSVDPATAESWGQLGFLGSMQAFILTPSALAVGQVKQEALDNFRRFSAQASGGWTLDLIGQPDTYRQRALRTGDDSSPNFFKITALYLLIFLVLLLVPAVSLSGMADSRMERRLAEMGVRRAFGARVSSLMHQILFENFVFTLLGGVAGLLFSYLLILTSNGWLMNIGQSFASLPPERTEAIFTPSMLLNLPVFGIALAVCFLLNLFSALLPAWRSSRHQIVKAINN